MSEKFQFTDDERIHIFSDLVAIKSVNDHETDVAKYIQQLLKKHDIEAKILPISETRADFIAEIGSGHPILGISGHMDVVPAGNEEEWTSDPFQLTLRDGNLYGRGAADMKSGLAGLLIAMIEIKENQSLQQGTIRLMATMGEEVGELGSRKFTDEGYMDDVDALFIGEPTSYEIAYAHKGSIDIRLDSFGKAAHSSMPEQGYNAIDPLMNLLTKAKHVFRDANKKSDLLGELSFNTTIFNGGNQVNSIPEKATAEINIRTVPEFNNDVVEQQMAELVKEQNDQGADIKMDIYMSQPSIETSGNNSLVKVAQKVATPYSDEPVKAVAITPVTDASNMVRTKGFDFPLAIFGPGSDSVHQVDEYVSKQMFLDFSHFYVELFTQYLNN